MPVPQSPVWISAFALPEEFTGAVIALDLESDGLWAARIEPDRSVAAEVREPRIVERTLDLRIAAKLRPRYPEAESPAAFGELVSLADRARERLMDLDSVMMLGDEHIRLLRVSLDDVRAATLPEVNRAHGMVNELAGQAPVDAVLLGPGGERWPGLWESLTDRGYTVLHPGDPFPATFGGDEGETSILDAVEAPPRALAWALEEEAAAAALHDGDGEGAEPLAMDGRAAAADSAELALAADGDRVDDDRVDSDGVDGDGGDGDGAYEEAGRPEPSDGGRRGLKQLLVAALAVGVIGGAAVALGLVAREIPRPAPETPEVAAASTGVEASEARDAERDQLPPTRVEPAEIREARETMLRYTTPTPTTTEPPAQPAETAPAPRPTPPDHRRTIPNPIPGLPPIVIG